MKYLNQEHENLNNSQQSVLMGRIARFSFDNRISVLTGCLISGILCSALAWQGSVSERIYFCVKATSDNYQICKDENNRPFRMTRWHWERWEKSGRSPLIVQIKVEPATNLYKPFLSGAAFVSFSMAGWLFRQFQFDENRKSKFDAIAQQRDEGILAIENQIELMEVATGLELSATDNAVIIQQAELLSEVEIKLTQMEVAETIFEAETAGMGDEQKAAYVEFVRSQKTPYLTGSQTLDKTCNPKDKVDGREQNILQIDWLTHAIDYFCILIWGGQGAGKTMAASHIVKGKKNKGVKITVLDPHAAKGQWKGLEVIGAGMDYESINSFMKWYFEECERRYKLLRNEGEEAVKDLGQICVVVEEITNYFKRCNNSPEFVQACLSDNRKIFISSIFISHGRTLSLIGGSQGTAKTRDDSFMELHCISPTGGNDRVWEVKYPGGGFSPVPAPNWNPILNFSEPSEPQSEPLNQHNTNTFVEENARFTEFNLTREQALGLINSLSSELNQTEIIERLWRCRKGGSAAWKDAYFQFKQLTDSQ